MLGLKTGQMRSEAGVGAATELHVLVCVGTVDDDRVGVVAPSARVTVRRRQPDVEHLARSDLDVAQLQRLGGDAGG